MEESHASVPPWYRQFWPWFLIALPGSVVVASIITVSIAVDRADSLVADNYYKDGLAINRQLAMDTVAESYQLRGDIFVDELIGEVHIELQSTIEQWPETLQLRWIHPTDKRRDVTMALQHRGYGRYSAQLSEALSGRWYLELTAQQPEPWRLKTELDLSQGNRFPWSAGG